MSVYLGGLVTWALGVTATDFHNLWLLCVICNFSTICVIPFLILVPSEKDRLAVTGTPTERAPLVAGSTEDVDAGDDAGDVSANARQNEETV